MPKWWRKVEGGIDPQTGKVKETGTSHKGQKPPPPPQWTRDNSAKNTKPPPPQRGK